MKVTIIRTSGEEEEHDVPFTEISGLCGCSGFDTVQLPEGKLMLVDDMGWETRARIHGTSVDLVPTKARNPINEKATKLYHSVCVPGTTHQIVGDVAIVIDAEVV